MYKVESTIHTKVKVEGSTTCIYVTSEDAYRIKESNLINLHIGEKVHTVIIKDIIYNKTLNLYQVKITGLSIDLLPNSTLDATIVTGVHSIGSFLFGSV